MAFDLEEIDAVNMATYETLIPSHPRTSPGWDQYLVDLFLEHFEVKRLLDIGCGTEPVFCNRKNVVNVGLDLSKEALKLAQERYRQDNFVRANYRRMPFRDHSFDGFWTGGSLWHTPKTHMSALLVEIARIMNTDSPGFIYMAQGDYEKYMPCLIDESYLTFMSYWKEEQFKQVLEEAGFKVEKMYKPYELPGFITFVRTP